MSGINFLPHQGDALERTKGQNRVAYYLDMGLGKTFVGSEKLHRLGTAENLVICQKSKVDDWVRHFREYYPQFTVIDYTQPKQAKAAPMGNGQGMPCIIVVNYELAFRRAELGQLQRFTLMLDESSMIQNEAAKRTKFVLKLNPDNVVLLSGTPTAGKYERLYSQLWLLGWDISKELYWRQYIETETITVNGFPQKVVVGYKNVDRLKMKLAQYGAVFMKSNDVFDLPEQVFENVMVSPTREYKRFMHASIVECLGIELVGDTTLTKRLYARQLCGHFNKAKLQAFRDLVDSTDDRLIVFYNFYDELHALVELVADRSISVINGERKDLSAYESRDDSITFVQYQSGAMGLNLQKANKIIYFTLPQSPELFDQSHKRTHRIGQNRRCFYYYLLCRDSVELDILKNLKMRKAYTDELFKAYESRC